MQLPRSTLSCSQWFSRSESELFAVSKSQGQQALLAQAQPPALSAAASGCPSFCSSRSSSAAHAAVPSVSAWVGTSASQGKRGPFYLQEKGPAQHELVPLVLLQTNCLLLGNRKPWVMLQRETKTSALKMCHANSSACCACETFLRRRNTDWHSSSLHDCPKGLGSASVEWKNSAKKGRLRKNIYYTWRTRDGKRTDTTLIFTSVHLSSMTV